MKRSWIKPSSKPKRLNERKLDGLFQEACLLRDNNRCQAPGCTREATGGVHHLIPRGYKAVRHYMPNGVSLCIEHHRYIHEGIYYLSLEQSLRLIHNSVGEYMDMQVNANAYHHQGGAEHLENFINEHK